MNLTGWPKQKYQPNWHDPGQRMRDGGAVGGVERGFTKMATGEGGP